MAITSLDLALAGERPLEFFSKAASGNTVAGRPFSPFYTAGVPGAAVAPTPGLSGAALTSYAGQIPVPAASGNTHLSYFTGVSSGQGGMLMLCDRLYDNSVPFLQFIPSSTASTLLTAGVKFTQG